MKSFTSHVHGYPGTLYRFFDTEGRLLWVGATSFLPKRLYKHSGWTDFWPEVARIDVEHFPRRSDAWDAERKAIATENPHYNIQRYAWAPPTPLMTPSQVAEHHRVGLATVRRWAKQGALQPVRMASTTRFRREDVEAFIPEPSTGCARRVNLPVGHFSSSFLGSVEAHSTEPDRVRRRVTPEHLLRAA